MADKKPRPLARRLKDTPVEALACRPVFSTALLFLLFAGVSLALSVRGGLLLSAFLLAFSIFFFFLCRREGFFAHSRLALILAFCALLLFLSYALWYFGAGRDHLRLEEMLRQCKEEGLSFTGTVEEADGYIQEDRTLVLRTETVEGERLCVRLLLSDAQVEAEVTDRVCGTALITPCFSETLSAPFGEVSGSVFGTASLSGEFSAEQNTEIPFYLRLKEIFSECLSEAKSAGLLRAILLGDRDGVPEELSEDLRRTGASHLLALSGLHLSLLTMLFYRFLRFAFCPRRQALFATLLLAGVFLIISGAPLSLQRAFLMLFLNTLSVFLRLRQSPVQGLVSAAALIVFFDRCALFDIGFLLSVLATLGILLAVPQVEERLKSMKFFVRLEASRPGLLFRRFLLSLLTTFFASYAAVTFTLPVIAFAFGEIALVSPVWGLLQIPLFSLLLGLAFFLLLSLLIGGFWSGALAALTDAVARLFADLCEVLSDLVDPVSVTSLPVLWVASAALILFVVFCLWYRVRLRVALLSPGVFLAVFWLLSLTLSLFGRLPIGAVLLRDANEEHLLLHTQEETLIVEREKGGAQADFDRLQTYLAANGVSRVDAVILPAVSEDTPDRLKKLYASVEFDTVYLPGSKAEELSELLTFVFGDRVRVCAWTKGECLEFSRMSVEMLRAESSYGVNVRLDTGTVYYLYSKSENALSVPPESNVAFVTGSVEVIAAEKGLLAAENFAPEQLPENCCPLSDEGTWTARLSKGRWTLSQSG